MQKITKIITAATIAILGFATAATPVYAANPICSQEKVSAAAKEAAGCTEVAGTSFQSALRTILNSIIGIMGLVAVIFIIIGGINYITSTGDAAKIQKGKMTILYAVIGLVVCALAFAIVNFTIDNIIKAQHADEDENAYITTTYIS